jgi:hypothetical protein
MLFSFWGSGQETRVALTGALSRERERE